MMKTQRLRNLTTGRLHTEMSHIYQDLEYITGMGGLMTHMLPNILRAVEPWLREKVVEPEYWNDEYDTSHSGEYLLAPMGETERANMLEQYSALPNPLAGKDVLAVTV